MIDHEKWFRELTGKLLATFGERLLFVGFQGSYRRGEATEKSDIDAVVILDRLGVDELSAYREIIGQMPEPEKACGFVAGREELRHWPEFEIFQLSQETLAVYGSLEGLLPDFGRDDIRESVRIGASAMYHALCHSCLHDDNQGRMGTLDGVYKGAFFILQLLHYLRTGDYTLSKKELLPLLSGTESEILGTCIKIKDGFPLREADMEGHFSVLIEWASGILISG